MGKLESTIKSEIERLSKREIHKVSAPLKRDVRSLKITISQLKKAVLPLQRFTADQQKELAKCEVKFEVSPEELKKSRFSPRLIKALRKHLGVSQRGLAALTGVTVGAVFQWEKGTFEPKDEKKKILVGLRKLGRREASSLLKEKIGQPTPKKKERAEKKSRREIPKK